MTHELRAKQAITEAIHRYARAEDRSDGELSATVWSDGATLNYGKVFKSTGAAFVANTDRRMSRYVATHHQVGNVLIDVDVDGDCATSEAYVTARCWNFMGDSGDPSENVAVGRYLDRWILSDGKWRSADRHFVLDLMYAWAPPRTASGATLSRSDRNRDALEGRHHQADPSYQFVGNVGPKAAAGSTCDTQSDLEAKVAIAEAIHRYARGEDRIDRDLSNTVWTDDAFLNYGAVFKRTAAEFLSDTSGLSYFRGTHHQVGNILIDVAGESANSEAYVTARCWRFTDTPGDLVEMVSIGRYCDRWTKNDGKWRNAARHFVLDMAYSWSPTRVPGAGAMRAADRNLDAIDGRRRPEDPSYVFLSAIAEKAAKGATREDLDSKQGIVEAIHCLARSEDRADSSISAGVWTPDAMLDYGTIFTAPASEFVRAFETDPSPFFATHHQIGNILIDIEGDQATTESYVTAKCWKLADDEEGDLTELTSFGRYCDRWVRDGGQWRNAGRRYILDMRYLWAPPKIASVDKMVGGTVGASDRSRNASEGGLREADPSHAFMSGLTRKRT